MRKINDYSLYLVISQEYARERSVLEVASLAISGGIDILQMREKDKSREGLLDLGRKLSGLCRSKNVTFIVNDDPYLAKEVDAHGLHMGQDDFSGFTTAKLRDIIGRDKIIGISTHSFEQFEKANQDDFDYISFGPIFPTKTKDYFIGTNQIRNVLKIASKPVVFIGGINLGNIDIVLEEGARIIALIRDIAEAEDIQVRTANLKNKLNQLKLSKITLEINGKTLQSPKDINLANLVAVKCLPPQMVVIELNSKIVPREKWTEIVLQEGDSVEIISFMAGG